MFRSFDLSAEALLPQRLIQHQGDAIGQIKRARLRVEHGDAQPVPARFGQNGLGQARSLVAKDQIILRGIAHFRVMARAALLDQPEPRVRTQPLLEDRPTGPAMPLDLLPVIHSSPLQVTVIELESEWLDQVEQRAGGGAQAGHIAGIGRDFGFDEDNLHEQNLVTLFPEKQSNPMTKRGLAIILSDLSPWSLKSNEELTKMYFFLPLCRAFPYSLASMHSRRAGKEPALRTNKDM